MSSGGENAQITVTWWFQFVQFLELPRQASRQPSVGSGLNYGSGSNCKAENCSWQETSLGIVWEISWAGSAESFVRAPSVGVRLSPLAWRTEVLRATPHGTFTLPFPVTPGDVVLTEPGTTEPADSDLIRFFTPAAGGPSLLLFYSDLPAAGEAAEIADLGVPPPPLASGRGSCCFRVWARGG